jgi:hypothetical protein
MRADAELLLEQRLYAAMRAFQAAARAGVRDRLEAARDDVHEANVALGVARQPKKAAA